MVLSRAVPSLYCLRIRCSSSSSSSARRVLEVSLDGEGADGEGEGKGYTDVTVREAVEWTMGKDSEFTYIDVRSAEEHEKLATVRYCLPILPRGGMGSQKSVRMVAVIRRSFKLEYLMQHSVAGTLLAVG